MPLPAILAGLARGAAAAGRAAGTGARLNPAAGRAGLPVAAPVGGGGAGGALSKFADMAGQAGQISFGIQALTGALKGLAQSVLHLPAAPIEMFTKALDLVQAPALAAVGALRGMRDAMTALGSSIAEFVQLASPVHVERFKLAADDLTASIGIFLIPVMEFATKLTRKFADVMFTLSGPLQRLADAVFTNLGTVLDALFKAAEPLIFVLGVMIDVLAKAERAFGHFISGAVKFLGLSGPSGLKDSTGAAIRNVGIGSVEDYGKKAQTAAFRLGSGADPVEKTADNTEMILNLLKGWVEKFPAWFAALPLDIARAILPGGPGTAARDIIEKGEARAAGVMKRVDRAHSAAVDSIENTFGIELPRL